MRYIVFEDKAWSNFLPFTYTRFTGDLRVGVLKLRQRLGKYFGFEPNRIIVREDLEALYKQRHADWHINNFSAGEYVFINSRLNLECLHASPTVQSIVSIDNTERTSAFPTVLINEIKNLRVGQKLISLSPTPENPPLNCQSGRLTLRVNGGNETVLAFKIKLEKSIKCNSEKLHDLYDSLETVFSESKNPLWNHTWEFLAANGNLIREDFQLVFYEEDNFMEIDPGVVALNPYDIWIGEGSTLKHGVILDASQGPIIIDENVTIMHNSVILGPAYIGKNSLIKIGAKIYGDTSIGPNCKIGGEVSGSIFQAYSNKQHEGFIGNSFIGEWINIGADTNNSDLKNTYKPVKVWFYPKKSKISTEKLFVGAFIGDHSKIGINCSINTGAVIGFGVNIYGSDLINDFIPSFSWGEAKSLIVYHFDKFIETAANVKIRRNEDLVKEEIALIKKIYENIKYYEDK